MVTLCSTNPLLHTCFGQSLQHLALLASRTPPSPGFPSTSLVPPHQRGPRSQSLISARTPWEISSRHMALNTTNMPMSPKEIPPDPSPKLQTHIYLTSYSVSPFGYPTGISK